MKKPIKSVNPILPQTLAFSFKTVELLTGPHAGMVLKVEDHTPVQNNKLRVKYSTPNNGPRVIVQHVAVKGAFNIENVREDVRLAFSQALPATIAWAKESGYSERASGTALVYARGLARFVPAKQTEENNNGLL